MFNLKLTGDRKTPLRLVRYDVNVKAVPTGLMMAHFAVVHPEGRPETETMEVHFSVPAAAQDDHAAIAFCWKRALEGLKEAYSGEFNLNVDMDLRIPLAAYMKGQDSVPPFIKEIANDSSAPAGGSSPSPLIR